MILTNISQFYGNPTKCPPFGFSDHFTIFVVPKIREFTGNKSKVIKTRATRRGNKRAVENVLSNNDWSCLDRIDSCEEKLMFFNTIVSKTLNLIMPIKDKKIHNNDAPWMLDKLKLGYLQGRDCCGHYKPIKLHRRMTKIRLVTISQLVFLSYAMQFYWLICLMPSAILNLLVPY